jgi:hypothetical protein
MSDLPVELSKLESLIYSLEHTRDYNPDYFSSSDADLLEVYYTQLEYLETIKHKESVNND